MPSPAMAPASIMGEITVTMTASAIPESEISILAMTSEEAPTQACVAIRATTIPPTIACVVAVNKLFTLLVPMRDPSASTLSHCVRRRETQDH